MSCRCGKWDNGYEGHVSMEELFRKGAELDVFELLRKIWEANSSTTLILVGLAGATWLIGGNILVVLALPSRRKTSMVDFYVLQSSI